MVHVFASRGTKKLLVLFRFSGYHAANVDEDVILEYRRLRFE